MMFNNYKVDHEIKIDDEKIDWVQEYIYLGQKIACPNAEQEIKRKIRKSASGRQHNV